MEAKTVLNSCTRLLRQGPTHESDLPQPAARDHRQESCLGHPGIAAFATIDKVHLASCNPAAQHNPDCINHGDEQHYRPTDHTQASKYTQHNPENSQYVNCLHACLYTLALLAEAQLQLFECPESQRPNQPCEACQTKYLHQGQIGKSLRPTGFANLTCTAASASGASAPTRPSSASTVVRIKSTSTCE